MPGHSSCVVDPGRRRLNGGGIARDQDALHQAGQPWEDGHIESFHDKLRDECLNRELFGNLQEACVILESWRVEYNERRPHSSLGTPDRLQPSNLLPSQIKYIPGTGLLRDCSPWPVANAIN